MKGNLTANHRHLPGMRSLAAEVITIALLDYQRKRAPEEAKGAIRDGRVYASSIIMNDRDQLRGFIFGGGMDLLIDLADLRLNGDCIRKEVEK